MKQRTPSQRRLLLAAFAGLTLLLAALIWQGVRRGDPVRVGIPKSAEAYGAAMLLQTPSAQYRCTLGSTPEALATALREGQLDAALLPPFYPPHIIHSPHNPIPPIHPTIPPTAPTVPKKQPPCTVTVQRGKLVFHLTKSEIWNSNCHDKCEVCNYHLFGGQIRQHRNLLWNINLCLLSPVNYTIILQ